MGAHSSHKHLLKDEDVERWHDNLARVSIITAEERSRRLGRSGQATGIRPKAVIEEKYASPQGFDDFIMGYVDKSLKKKGKHGRRSVLSPFIGEPVCPLAIGPVHNSE